MANFTIAPRFADKAGKIPMPNARNVLRDNRYVGHIVIHDGAWTPLYRTEDLAKPDVVETLKAAADQMNSNEDAR